jgi:Fe-S-cluster-containing dehydrogenase component/DMSO reductase anchor subunit
MQKAFGFDVSKCTGCEACQVACTIENRVSPGIGWRRVFTFNPRGVPGVPSFHHSLACNHCEDPPCLNYCPALVFTRDPETGAVGIDPDRCIGCRYCSWVCPFDAPRFDPSTGVVEKCTFCAHRLETGYAPACTEACPTGALTFVDRSTGTDPSSKGARATGFVESNARPAIRFIRSRESRRAPDCSADRSVPPDPAGGYDPVPAPVDRVAVGHGGSRISVRSEWTLLVFTLLQAVLVGAFLARLPVAGGSDSPWGWPVPVAAIAIAGVAATALSALHLGRKERAWRAILNVRRSWLSREIVFFVMFVAAVSWMSLPGAAGGSVVAYLAAASGAAALVAADRLYHKTNAPGVVWHSAQTVPTALQTAGLLSGNILLFGLMCVLKTLLYLKRKYALHRSGESARPWLTRLRVLGGLAAPLALWWYGSPAYYPYVVLLVLAGEITDRTEFYLELDLPSPARQMAVDLKAAARTV